MLLDAGKENETRVIENQNASDNQLTTMRLISPLIFMSILAEITQPIFADSIIANGVISTSLIRVLAHPEQYNGKKVELIGYYQSGLEENALYLTKEDSKNSNYENSVWIGGIASNANPDRIHHFKNGFIRVIGTFSCNSVHGSGHLGLWPAELTDITFFNKIK